MKWTKKRVIIVACVLAFLGFAFIDDSSSLLVYLSLIAVITYSIIKNKFSFTSLPPKPRSLHNIDAEDDNDNSDYDSYHKNNFDSIYVEIPKFKKYNTDASAAQERVAKAQESIRIVNTTTNPKTFFKRYHFTLDSLLDLMTYDTRLFPKGHKPEDDYRQMIVKMEAAVNDMLDRSINKAAEDASKLKTPKARYNRIANYLETVDDAFYYSNTYWGGNPNGPNSFASPHYNGKLYTQANLNRFYKLKEDMLQKYFNEAYNN